MKPIHFDLTVPNVAQARRFFENLFGWRFERFADVPYEYYRIQAGPPDEPGIDGGIAATADAPLAADRPMTALTVPVADLDATLAKVQAEGGRLVEPKMPIPGIGWYATCAEPGGLLFGVIQEDPRAGSA
jgi:uncharacterized protein